MHVEAQAGAMCRRRLSLRDLKIFALLVLSLAASVAAAAIKNPYDVSDASPHRRYSASLHLLLLKYSFLALGFAFVA